jgi:hypothetical protein
MLGAGRRRMASGVVAASLLVLAVATVAYHPSWAGELRGNQSAPQNHAKPTPKKPARGTSPVRGIGVLRLGSSWEQASGYGRYAQLIVSRGFARQVGRAPGRSLVHFSGTDVNERYSTGVPYARAAASGWLLRGSDGSLLENQGYGGNFIGDVGNAAYQQTWIRNVSRFLRVYHDDGVMIDDVLRDIRPLAGGYPNKYPTQPQWAAAMASFVSVVGHALRAKGYYVAVNAPGYTMDDPRSGGGTLDAAWWRQLAPSVDGFVNEYYVETPNGENKLRSSGEDFDQQWDGWQRLIGVAQRMHRDFIGLTYGASGDTRAMMYGRASFLLDWNGGSSSFAYNTTDNSDPWNAAWTIDIGLPAGSKQRVGAGWLRRYTRGVALVNPSPSNSQTFALGRGYRTSSGETVTSVTLDPTTSLILRATS